MRRPRGPLQSSLIKLSVALAPVLVALACFVCSYIWVTEQRKLALTRAYQLIRGPDGTVACSDWVQLMSFLRPDCNKEHVGHSRRLSAPPVPPTLDSSLCLPMPASFLTSCVMMQACPCDEVDDLEGRLWCRFR